MRSFGIVILIAFGNLTVIGQTADAIRVQQLERQGDVLEARTILQRAVDRTPDNPDATQAYAEFLDRYRDPDARAAYEKALKIATGPRANAIARRLLVLDLLAGDRAAASRHSEVYTATGGGDLTPSVLQRGRNETAASAKPIAIPGPVRSFARMAALSPDLRVEDLLPALARNIVTNGYQAAASNEALEQTEYLKLVVRYLSQARELEKLAAANQGSIKIEACDSTQTADLLRVLGYRMRGACGSEVVLETVNATRAFLTIDSGFPLAELEAALRTNRAFLYDFQPTKIPVLYSADYWVNGKDKGLEFIDAFIGDPALCRLYLGMSKLDDETASALKEAVPMQRLKAFAHVLDFYGGMFQIRKGVAIVPGGESAWPAWTEFTGKGPKDGVAFFERLLTRDDGWMASYFDALARISGPSRDYLLDAKRMHRFYTAMRGRVTSPGPARPVFRASTDLMLLTQRLRIERDGKAHIPGSLEIWRNLFVNHPHGKYDGKLTKLATSWKEPDDLLEALFALCRKSVDNEPLKIYMALTDLNRFRSKPLEPATVDRLAREYRQYGAQYPVFSEAPMLSDRTILQYLDTAQSVNGIRDALVRADTAGSLQALVSLWQILTREGTLPPEKADETLARILDGFGKVRGHVDVFDAGRGGLHQLLGASGVSTPASSQDAVVDLLAGGTSTDADAHRQVAQSIIQVMEAQRLISLDSIFQLADNLESLTKGQRLNTALVTKLAARIAEVQLPRASLSPVEKNSLAFGYWTEKHIDQQRKINLRAAIEKAANDPEKLRDLRGLLAPLLRDTLVGFSYAHYAPPGAQILQTNPVFVRSHDFLGIQGAPQTWRTTEVFGTGWPSSAGGRLVGSLSGLPYALAEAEQNFLIPSREQALIWGDLVPQMILSSKISRWWNVTPAQVHWVGLHMGQAETLIAEASLNEKRRTEVLDVLNRHAPPARLRRVADLLEQGRPLEAVEFVTPSEMFLLAADWWAANPGENGTLSREARKLVADAPKEITYAAISRAFGTPKPTLTNSYKPELLNLRTFPTLMGYSSRIMAESWESNLLYYAALADQVHLPPSQLNIAVPEWTQRTVEKIFATHLEDWPALLRSLRLVGEDVRTQARKQMSVEQKASISEPRP